MDWGEIYPIEGAMANEFYRFLHQLLLVAHATMLSFVRLAKQDFVALRCIFAT